jgi:hypothetical protein
MTKQKIICSKTVQNWPNVAENGQDWPTMAKNGRKWSKMTKAKNNLLKNGVKLAESG